VDYDTLEYSWVKATIGICTLADHSVAKERQQWYHLSDHEIDQDVNEEMD
jgi:hypothetical protein